MEQVPNSPSPSQRRMRGFLHWVVLPVLFAAFAWLYFISGVDFIRALTNALFIAYVILALGLLYSKWVERKQSGLSEDEYILKQAGGANALLDGASFMYAIGWFCLIAPTLLTLILFIAVKSNVPALISLFVTGPICIPCAVACFVSASKRRRIAERAGATIYTINGERLQ